MILVQVALMSVWFVFTAQATDAVEGACMTCHKEKSPGLYRQWYASEHAKHEVTCYDCHEADRSEPDAFLHEEAWIATLVTPKDCGECHEKEMLEVDSSHHATAGLILESADAYLAHAAGGHPVAIAGCENCHGSKIKIDENSPNKLSNDTWPNSGIGRLNPDDSKGSCTACHTRHQFDTAQARRPEACSKCHLGPDHPQKEIYEASKHGNAFYTQIDKMNLDSDRWIVGEDYWAAPTCATCHMSATSTMAINHDVGDRISWSLRPPVSKRQDNWEEKRASMQGVCRACHSQNFAEGHYRQMDGLINLYDEKFAIPAGAIMAKIKEKKLLDNPAAFSNKIEWIYWEIWHHEGRRARHGAAMMGPDYTWWHGIYEVAQHFYFKFIPEARKLNDPEVNAMIDEMLQDDMHSWLGKPTDEIKADIKSGELQKTYEHMIPE
ncbi:MAG: hydroxylamine oxidoreductase [Proteobacteria bacterium]|nr:hydroxylamine oxidoreductase [Pseudomonadota bacterium]